MTFSFFSFGVVASRLNKAARCASILFSGVLLIGFFPVALFAQEAPVLSYEKTPGDSVRVFVDGAFFAECRPDFKGTPIIWPICAPNGNLATRAWPMIDAVDVENEPDAQMKTIYQNAVISERGGVKDHPHHRSFWFNHGNVSGGDFWGGTPSVIRQTKAPVVESDGKTVSVTTENYWRNDKLDRDVCRDVRTSTFGVCNISSKPVRYVDFSVTIEALEDNVVFGDTKEGSFGIRVPSPTAVTSKKLNPNWGGTILNDAGEVDGETWSKRSLWVDYVGPVEKFLTGEELNAEFKRGSDAKDFPLSTFGVAVLSGENSLGAPAWRHVRDYGLFASNPFGWRDFEPSNPKADGTQILNKGEKMFFNFRVLFHNGDLTPEDLDKAYVEYSKR